jgi:MOSC domain-containing protein YiiM
VCARVTAVSVNTTHAFSKRRAQQITLLAGLGVEGDAHCGVTVKHRSRVARDPTQPNLRQVHLLHTELFEELAAKGFSVAPGALGENISTSGISLLSLPVDTELRLGESAVVRLTGLRNPCAQLNEFQTGLMAAVLDRTKDGALVRRAGVMSIVVCGGIVRPGDAVNVTLPVGPLRALEPV